jgi:hypothetical protein
MPEPIHSINFSSFLRLHFTVASECLLCLPVFGCLMPIFGCLMPVFGCLMPIFGCLMPIFGCLMPIFGCLIPIFGCLMPIFGCLMPIFPISLTFRLYVLPFVYSYILSRVTVSATVINCGFEFDHDLFGF